MTSSTPSPTETPRPFWVRRLRDPIVQQLTQGISAEKIALTLAIGTALALFPVIGTTTLLCFAAAWALRLNQPIIHTLNQLLWPVHLATIIPCIRLGDWLLGVHDKHVDLRAMNDLFWSAPGEFFHRFGTIVLHAILGWIVAAPFLAVFLFVTLAPIIRQLARWTAKKTA